MDENLGLGVLLCIYGRYFWCPIASVWFGVIRCKISNSTIFKKSPIFRAIHPNFIHGIIIIQPVSFWGDLLKIAKIMAFWNLLNAGRYAAIIFKVLYLHNFHWCPSKLYDNIEYHGKSKCLLENCNEKLSSSHLDNIFHLKLFKTFLCTGASVQADHKGPWAFCFDGILMPSSCNHYISEPFSHVLFLLSWFDVFVLYWCWRGASLGIMLFVFYIDVGEGRRLE